MSPPWHELRFRLDHQWTPPHMPGYLDADLSARASVRLERHTAECRECWSVLNDLRYMLALLKRAPPPERVADATAIVTAVMRRLHEPADH